MASPQNTPQPPQQQQTVVSTVFKAVGLDKLTKQWEKFGDSLIDPILVLAAGGTKAQAAWAGFRAVFLTKVLGPLGLVAGAATGFLLTTRLLIKEWRTFGVAAAKSIETLTLQFKPLFGSLDLAKKRAREVFSFSVKSPFKFGELAEGNKILQALTRGALAGKDGMTLVGDAAAVAGEDFASMSRQVGRLYDGLMSGRPVGEAAFRLQELGVISGDTRNQIEAMQAANASGSAVWAVAERDIMRAKGAMEALSESLAGLESTYEDTRTQLQAGFGEGFMEGEKAGIKSATLLMEKMTPAATYFGQIIGTVSNAWEKFKHGLVESALAGSGFTTAMKAAGLGVIGLAASISMAAGMHLAKFALGIRSIAAGQVALTQATVAATGVQTAAQLVTVQLASAKAALVAALKAVAAGNVLAAVSNIKLAATETVVAVRTNAAAAAQVVFRGALALTKVVALSVVSALRSVAVAMLGTPIGWIATGLTVAAGAMLHFYNESKKAREELEAFANASRATAAALRQQEMGIRTVADLRKAEADTITKLAEAYRDLYLAQREGNKDKVAIAEKSVRDLSGILGAVRGHSGKTVLGDEDVALEDARKEREKAAKDAREVDDAGRGESSAVEVARRRLDEFKRLKDLEDRSVEAEKRIEKEREAARRKVEDVTVRQSALEGERGALIHGDWDMSPEGRKSFREKLAALNEQLEVMRQIRAEVEAQGVAAALGSGSELMALAEKRKAYGDLVSAKKRFDEADEKRSGLADDAKDQDRLDADLELGRSRAAIASALAAAKTAGVDGWLSRDDQNAERRMAEIRKKRAENQDPAIQGDLERQLRDAEMTLAQGRLDVEKQIDGLRLRGYERDLALLAAERKALDAEWEAGRRDDESYQRESRILDERERVLKREGEEKRADLADAAQAAARRNEERVAREKGDRAAEMLARKQAEALEDSLAERAARREAEGSPDAEAVVQQVMENVRRERDAETAAAEAARVRSRAGAEADAAVRAAGIQGVLARLTGRGKEAEKIEESAARKKDRAEMASRQKELIDMGYGEKQARAMALKDMKSAQAERLISRLNSPSATVVASSLAEVGGGGNTYNGSRDKGLVLLERIAKAVEEVNDPDVDEVGW